MTQENSGEAYSATVSLTQLDEDLIEILEEYPSVSDINFTVGKAAQAEVEGRLVEMTAGGFCETLTPEETRIIAGTIIDGNKALKHTLAETGSVDCGYETCEGHRFRANIFKSRGHYSVVLRVLSTGIPTLQKLELPTILGEIPKLKDGIVLVTGSTGSGKSTTLAALVDAINNTRPAHIITLEDPIEFVHPHKYGTVNQRELGRDFAQFSDGLRAALRQAPKVILVGEIRDRDTLEIALKAAETGQLVLSTLHTVDAGQTVNRILGMFNPEERNAIRGRLSQVMRFVISQRLVPRVGGGRIAALEVMGASMRVRELILHGETTEKTFRGVIADARPHGWQTFDQHIVELFKNREISLESAQMYCSDRGAVMREIDRVASGRPAAGADIGELEMENQTRPKRDRRV